MIFAFPTPSNWWKNRPKNQLKKCPKFEHILDQFFVHLGSQNGPKNGPKLVKKSNKKSTKFWRHFCPIFPPFCPPTWEPQGEPKVSQNLAFWALKPSWSQLGPTWANLGPTWGQLGANLGQLGTNLEPTWGQLGAKLGQLGVNLLPTWANLGPKFQYSHLCPKPSMCSSCPMVCAPVASTSSINNQRSAPHLVDIVDWVTW